MNGDDIALPPLRQDLQIVHGGASYSGAPFWMVFDPLRNRFFRITFEMFQILSLWNYARTRDGLNRAVKAQFGREVEPEDIGQLMQVLDTSFFLERSFPESWRGLYQRSQHRHSWFMRLVHNYLFFRIPLVRPEPFLRAAWPYVSPLFSRSFLLIVVLIGLAGLYFVSRQWDAFVGTFSFVFSFEGLATSVLSIVFVKSMHELGHAFTAHRHGCRVPTMGIAFMVMVPMLYTDVTDAWRLKSRKARLSIDLAGVVVELCIAALALFLWAFMPDGPLRSALFVLAATSWVLSLLVNISPFMRFDGYYMLADLLGIENLQPRAFRHMRWRLREMLFGLDHPAPEPFPPRLDAILTIYAICTTIYRLTLYLGIALLVYHFTIKIVGVMLFLIEVSFFILRPVRLEVSEWWSMRHDILASRRTYISAAILLAILVLCAMPLSTHIGAPALIQPERFARLFPAEAGQVEQVAASAGQQVRQGDVLFVIASPAAAQERKLAEIEIGLAQRRLDRIGADPEDKTDRGIIEAQLASLRVKRDGLARREAKLVVRAPFDGRIRETNRQVVAGRWVSRKEQLAFLEGGDKLVARGYVAGSDRERVAVGSAGWFVPDDLSQERVPVRLTEIAVSGAQQLDIPQITSQFGGRIAVHREANGVLVPAAAEYALSAEIVGDVPDLQQTERGVLVLDGEPQSLLARAWRQVLKVLVREAGA